MFKISLLLFWSFLFFVITISQAQDTDGIGNPVKNVLTEQSKVLLNKIKLAEDNEDWDSYITLRAQLIQELKQSNPELAKSYRTISNDKTELSNIDGDANISRSINSGFVPDEEFPSQTIPEKWENDVPFYSGQSLTDFSMDVSAEDHIYVSVATRNGSSNNDTLKVYRSLDGGLTWDFWIQRYTTGDYNKTEILCFDSPSGEKYILLFYTYSGGSLNQQFRVVRYDQATGSLSGSVTLIDSLVSDFAVDRNYPGTYYRAIAFYDSANYMYSLRSEPSSYGTVWQDKHFIGHVGKDVDLCYGYSGSVYATYNGYGSGNLYIRENLNYADPASWSTFTILESGSTDTTMHAEVIATRETQPNIKVQVFYTQDENNTLNLKRAQKDNGGSWSASIPVVTNLSYEFKYPCLDINHWGGTTEVHCVYRSEVTGGLIAYLFDSGTSWTGSQYVSDYLPTGTQKPYVAEVNGEPVVVYAGWGPTTLYCDNNGSVTSITGDNTTVAKGFQLYQNYPNPFNPSTTIKYQIPDSKSANTTLQIFNNIGQLVRTLVNTEQSNGEYSVVWNGLDNNGNAVSSGVYFYKLIHGNLIKSRKLLKLK